MNYDGQERRRGDTERTLGEHSAKLASLGNDVSEIKDDVKKLLAKENEREGSKKIMYTFATIFGGAAGAVAAKFLK